VAGEGHQHGGGPAPDPEYPDRPSADLAGEVIAQLGRLKWFCWHGNVFRALIIVEDLLAGLDTAEVLPPAQAKMLKAVREFDSYLRPMSTGSPTTGNATAFTESMVNQVIAKRMVKKQQMRWTPRGAHLLLQVPHPSPQRPARQRLPPLVPRTQPRTGTRVARRVTFPRMPWWCRPVPPVPDGRSLPGASPPPGRPARAGSAAFAVFAFGLALGGVRIGHIAESAPGPLHGADRIKGESPTRRCPPRPSIRGRDRIPRPSQSRSPGRPGSAPRRRLPGSR
jgi:hypothetical protein